MESNGKRVDREGRPVDYATAPVLWGAEGTVSQHSFHQLLHQGTQIVPATSSTRPDENALGELPRAGRCAGVRHRRPVAAAAPALSRQPPFVLLSFDKVTPRNLGRLIALYEHKVFTQGVIWNINSFDQWGVELGKEIARKDSQGEYAWTRTRSTSASASS